ncbi:MAG: ester cyclase [Actinobacteria bacterium]|nr:ester cyclase [Actinomycetota bacterium]
MESEGLKASTLEGFEAMFNRGDLEFVDRALARGAVDHEEPAGTDLAAHLKTVISTLRTAFPDLRFEVHELVAEGDVVACRSTMRGTHRGPLHMGPMAGLAVNGASVEVPHMHFFRYDAEGKLTDLWHVWNTLMLARQLGAPAPDLSVRPTETERDQS